MSISKPYLFSLLFLLNTCKPAETKLSSFVGDATAHHVTHTFATDKLPRELHEDLFQGLNLARDSFARVAIDAIEADEPAAEALAHLVFQTAIMDSIRVAKTGPNDFLIKPTKEAITNGMAYLKNHETADSTKYGILLPNGGDSVDKRITPNAFKRAYQLFINMVNIGIQLSRKPTLNDQGIYRFNAIQT